MAPAAAATKTSAKSASALKAKPKDKPAGADIRSFFGKSSQTTQTGSSQDKVASSSQKNAISIDEDDAPTPVKKPAPELSKTPAKPQVTTAKEPAKPAAAAKAAPAAKATPASAKRKKVAVSDDEEEDSPPKKKPAAGSSKPRASTTKQAAVVLSSDDEPVVKKPAPKKATKPDDEDWEMDDVEDVKPKAKPRKSNGARVVDSDSDDVEAKPKAKPQPRKSAAKTVVDSDSDEVKPKLKPRKSIAKTVVDSDEEDVKPKPKAKPRKSATAKDDGDDDEPKPKPKAKPRQSAAAKIEDEDGDVKPAVEDKPKPKNNFAAMKAARAAGPSAPGSKPVPEGEPNCFAGLTFVFTGELSSLAREEAQDLAKRYGGRVTGAPSGKTSYVIVGANAGASKLKALEKHGIPTLDEDGFLNLIATRKGFLDEKTKEKMRKEEEKLKEQVRELEERERKATKAAKKALKEGTGGKKVYDPSEQLWTTKYAPANLREICGNKAAVEKLRVWLEKWQENMKTGFKKPGKDAMGVFRAVLITGPPGIGKTTTAHLVAKMEGYTPLELNASDARSKKLIENGANIDNRSLDGWMAGEEGKTNAVGVAVTERTCLIMDEVDGMSAGDRGGVGALNALIKKTKIPIICIANDGRAQKLQPLKATTFNMTFSKPQVQQIRSRIMTIVMREGMKVPPNVIDQLIAGAQSDIRQVLNMLSTWKLSNDTMDFDESKHLTKMNEKYSVMTPFNVITKVLGPYMFSSTSRETLSEKMEYYFHDHSFVPLFMQENYLRSTPARLQGEEGPFRDMKHLELMEKAASSLSDADLVDAMIHGNDQHWSLMPLHAVVSTVRPAYHMYGTGAHWGGQDGIRFPSWLGQNSKEQKLRRQLAEVQIKMRLRATGSKAEVRLGYLPTLHNALVRPLQLEGADAIDDVIAVMDEYHLNREDWDTLGELGLGKLAEKETVAQIKTATKTAFTKRYNAGDHPVAFHKQEFGKAPKKIAAAHGPAPDLEDAFDIEDDDVVADDKEPASDDDNIENDKLIKKPRGAAAAGTSKGKGKATNKAPAKPKAKK